jgi:ubiquinone/menaquinone biosynthesis C-methylase UbiE
MSSSHEDLTSNEFTQIEHYAGVAAEYVRLRKDSVGHQLFLDLWVNRILGPINTAPHTTIGQSNKILDPMCGSGETTKQVLNNLNGQVFLSDISVEMLRLIPEEVENHPRTVVMKAQTARRLNFEDDSVDVIFVSGGLHHVFPILHEVLNEFYRVLKPGGFFVFGEPYDGWIATRMLRRAIYKYSSKFDETSEFPFDQKNLLESLEKARFESIRLKPWGGLGYLFSGPMNVIPILGWVKSSRFWSLLFTLDEIQSRVPIFRQTCLTVTGSAKKPFREKE